MAVLCILRKKCRTLKERDWKGAIHVPELPEMETYKTLLCQQIGGKTILDVIIHREKSINKLIDEFILKVKGKKVVDIERRAKYLLFHLSSGDILLLHLMLGGWMYYGTEEDKPKRTTQIELIFDQKTLYFFGLRLGYLHLFREEEVNAELSTLGPEPLSEYFTEDALRSRLKGKKGVLKNYLVDQHRFAGIGNCYSDEICFAAELLPTKTCMEINEQDFGQLYQAVRSVLKEAVEKGGYMEHPFFLGDSLTGGFDQECKVYDREGELCLRCGTPIHKSEISARKTFFCLNCQH
jgi:formamidopyrimidine-DNA glycosylase